MGDIFRSTGSLWFHHAFVSYRSEDVSAAKALTETLQDVFGLRAWLDLDAGSYDRAPRMAGDVRGKPIAMDDSAIESALHDAISGSILVVVLSSPRVLASLWVRKEIGIAEDLGKPVFFWHLAEEGEARAVSVRRGGGQPLQTSAPDAFVEALAKDYRKERLATTQSADFMRELSRLEDLNVVGHTTEPASQAGTVALELNSLIELCELILTKGEAVNPETVQRIWPDYEQLDRRCEELTELIFARYGRHINVGRMPVAHAFRLKRSFVAKRVAHLEQLLNDETYRLAEFRNLGD